jgi:tripartite-type tricarboxylate transporter receptor subunit TctC
MKTVCCLLAALAVGFAAAPASAQGSYPDKTIRILVGFTPGVAPDITSRLLADRFGETWGKAAVVENVTGAGGNTAVERTAKSAPDGYTLVMGGNAALVISPNLYDKLPYDPLNDFAYITQVFIVPNLLVVPADSLIKSLPELIAAARANPGQLTYGHAGIGTSQHLGAELLKSMAGLDVRHVPYRGTTAMLPDLTAGRLSMCFCNISNVLPLVREGKLRAFAISSRRRSPLAPEIPTMDEAGYPGFDATAWFGLMAPAGTPAPILDTLYRETSKALAEPPLRKKLEDLGLQVVANTPAEFAGLITAEMAAWGKVIKSANIRVGE